MYKKLKLLYNQAMDSLLALDTMDVTVDKDSDLFVVNKYLDLVLQGVKSPVIHMAKELNMSKDTLFGKIYRNKAYIKEKVDMYFKHCDIDRLSILAETKNIAFFNIKNFAMFKDGYLNYEDWDKLPDSVTACVKNITVNENMKTGMKTIHFDFYDKQKALDQLMKLLNLGGETVKHTHEGVVEHRLFSDVYSHLKEKAVDGTCTEAA